MALISATRNFGSNGLSLAALQEIARNLLCLRAFTDALRKLLPYYKYFLKLEMLFRPNTKQLMVMMCILLL